MNLYDAFMSPLEKRFLISLRKKIIPLSKGDVLEIGAGTGVNFSFYDKDKIISMTILDNDKNTYAANRAEKSTNFVEGDAAEMPFADSSFDTVVETLMLCSVEDVERVLGEIRRVLRPGGIFLHIDHGLPSSKGMRKVFRLLAPLWHGITGSCRIDKEYKSSIEAMGFKTLEEGSKVKGVFYWGVAKKSE